MNTVNWSNQTYIAGVPTKLALRMVKVHEGTSLEATARLYGVSQHTVIKVVHAVKCEGGQL